MFRSSLYPNRVFMLWVTSSLLLLGVFLLGLDQALLFDVDEGAFTEATREMIVSRDWWHTTLNGVDRFDKPIAIYWLQAFSASFLELNEFAFRLPSAIAGWIASLALAYFAYEKWGGRAAFLAAVISATSLGPWAMARTATADALLGLFFVLIFLDLWRALANRNLFHVRRLAVWIALGLLVKGPVAIVVPLGTLCVYALFSSVDRSHMRTMIFDKWSWVLLIAISLPWYLYAYLRHGQNFIEGFLLKHNVERFTGSLEGHSGQWFYFLIALPLLWLPWSAMWIKSLFNFSSHWKEPFLKFSWIWFGFVFCFFTLANTKLPHYLLYAGPSMCFLILQSALGANKKTWILTWLLAIVGFVFLIGLPDYLLNHVSMIGNDYYKVLLENAPPTDTSNWMFVLPLVVLLFTTWGPVLKKFQSFKLTDATVLGFTIFALFQAGVLSLLVLPWWSQVLQAPVHALAMKFRNSSVTVVQWGVHLPSFASYRLAEAPKREPIPGELALVKNIRPHWPLEWEIVETNGPLAIVKVPLVSQLKP